MSFPISAALLDAIVLSVVAQEPEGTYGYRITQQVTHTLELSESTLYPVLRRLQKDQLLTVYDAPVNGRNRRYYQITAAGRSNLPPMPRSGAATVLPLTHFSERWNDL